MRAHVLRVLRDKAPRETARPKQARRGVAAMPIAAAPGTDALMGVYNAITERMTKVRASGMDAWTKKTVLHQLGLVREHVRKKIRGADE